MINNIPPEGEFIRQYLKMLFAGGGRYILDKNLDWKVVEYFISYHEIGPFLHLALKANPAFVPPRTLDYIRNGYYLSIQNNHILSDEFLRIYQLFEHRNIAMSPLKGIALLEDIYLPFPIRPMVDIDILVKEDDLEMAGQLLLELDYAKDLQGLTESYWRDSQCHIVFNKRGKRRIVVELHWGIDFKRRKRTVLSEIWDKRRSAVFREDSVRLLSPEDTLFTLSLHARRFGKILCMKNSIDTYLLFKKYIQNFDWRYVFDKCDKYGLYSAVFYNIHQAAHIFDMDTSQIDNKFKIARRKRKMIMDFIQDNTFAVPMDKSMKKSYLKLHLLLYDNFFEPALYIMNIPREQFFKFYNLQPYDRVSGYLYKWRLAYIPSKAIINKFLRNEYVETLP